MSRNMKNRKELIEKELPICESEIFRSKLSIFKISKKMKKAISEKIKKNKISGEQKVIVKNEMKSINKINCILKYLLACTAHKTTD
jgi:hypothetical protein